MMPARNPVPIRRFDPVIEILIPLCIVGLVGSLIYFLIDLRAVLIAGSKTQLRVVSAALLVACVQIARIRAYTRSRWIAAFFTLLTLGAVGFFIVAFTFPYYLDPAMAQPIPTAARHLIPSGSGPSVALILHTLIVALIWWSTSLLTTACTLDPDAEEVRGEGMLGWLLRSRPLLPAGGEEEGIERSLVPPSHFLRKRYHPGQAVIYFGLIALVVFGAGQRLLAGGPPELRRDGLICMLTCIFCALLLLSLTSLSGLRLYLRKRAVVMPPGTLSIWVLSSLLSISFILAVACFLPKPPSQAAAPIAQRPPEDFGQRPVPPPRWWPFPGFRPTEEPSPRTGESGSRQVPGGPRTEGDRGDQGEHPGRAGQGQTGERGQSGQAISGGEGRASQGGTGGRPDRSQASRQPQERGGAQQQKGASGPGGAAAASRRSPDETPRGRSLSLNLKGRSGWWWWLLLLLLLLLLYLLYRKRREIAEKVRAWWHRQKRWLPPGLLAWIERMAAALRRLWERVRRWWIARRLAQMAAALRRRRTVDPFQDPFAPGSPFQGRPLRDVVMHIYHALLAYAALRGCGRAPQQTPLEYLRELPEPLEPLRGDVEFLTGLYVQAAYAGGSLPSDCLPALQTLWSRLMAQVHSLRNPKVLT